MLVVEPPARGRLGYLLMHRLALRKQANTPRPAMFFRHARAASASGARARAETTSASCGGRASMPRSTSTVRRQARLARDRREERGLALVALDQAHRRGPAPRSAASAAITRPGKPAPEPRSSQRRAPRRPQRPELRGVGEVPGPGVGEASPATTRLIRGFHLLEQREVGLEPLALFHVKHRRPRRNASAVGVTRRRAASSCRARSRTRVSAAGVMPSIRAACARRLRPHRAELVAQLARQPGDRRRSRAPPAAPPPRRAAAAPRPAPAASRYGA